MTWRIIILLLFCGVARADYTPGSVGRTWTLNSATDSVAVSGSIEATNPSVSNIGAPVPAQATFVGFQDSSGNLAPVVLTPTGAVPVATTPISISSATITQVSTSTGSSVLLLTSNPSRNSFILYNSSAGFFCYVAFASTASPSSFSFVLPQGATYQMDSPAYQGPVSAYCNSGSISVTSM